MTQIADIDVQGAVSKFLGKDTTSAGALESIATAFLLNPQIAVSFILRARNRLHTVVGKQIALINGILDALKYVNNPEVPITSAQELTNAKVALIQLDKLGRLTNATLEGYQSSIDNFLNSTLNRARSGVNTVFALSQIEAKEDVYIGLAGFILYHRQIIDLMNSILSSIDNFNKTDLGKIVSQRIVTNVKESVTDVSNNLDELSKVSIIIELLAGKASLSSVSNPRSIDSPVVETGVAPVDTYIQVISERVPATATSSVLPLTIASDVYGMTIDGTFAQFDYPRTPAKSRAFITSNTSQPTFNIPANSALYVKVTYNVPIIGPVGPEPDTIQINITPGIRTFNEIVTDIENGLSCADLAAAITRYGHCTSFAKDGSNILLIYGVNNVTGFQIRGSVAGTYILGVYNYPKTSVHDILGFEFNQMGTGIGVITPGDLSRFISLNYPSCTVELIDNKIRITSPTSTETSTLGFSGIGPLIGFPSTSTPQPTHLVLKNSGVDVLATTVDVHSGYQMTVGSNKYTITQTDGSKLFVDQPITPIPLSSVSIYSDTYLIISSLLAPLNPFKGVFDNDIFNFEQVVGPILTSNPSLAQVGDCKKVLQQVLIGLQNLNTVLNSYKLDNPKSSAEDIAKEIIFMLESRGMNNLIELLNSCKFKEFFSSTIDQASSGTNFMSAVEEVGKNDLVVLE